MCLLIHLQNLYGLFPRRNTHVETIKMQEFHFYCAQSVIVRTDKLVNLFSFYSNVLYALKQFHYCTHNKNVRFFLNCLWKQSTALQTTLVWRARMFEHDNDCITWFYNVTIWLKRACKVASLHYVMNVRMSSINAIIGSCLKFCFAIESPLVDLDLLKIIIRCLLRKKLV